MADMSFEPGSLAHDPARKQLEFSESKIAPVYEVRTAETADGCKVFAGISVVLAGQVASGKDQ